jgi:2-keto-4-pentenoate hydratase/2-oxohepta-3-ene-1,7-dioic acid hydratase in catechol pathway
MDQLAHDALDSDKPGASLADAHVLAPLQPPTIRDFVCFLDHMRNATATPELAEAWNETPAFYFTNPYATLGPNDPVPIPLGSTMFDFELEVGAVIGREGSNLHPDQAGSHIAGYLIFCDWSARDIQFHESNFGLGPAKAKDSSTTIGPMFVSADELEPYHSGKGFSLAMRAYINGVEVTSGSLDQLDWSFAEIAAYASRGTHIQPGDVLGSGTVPGGCLLEHAMTHGDDFRGWLQPDDTVRLEVELLGTLEMSVTAGADAHPTRETPPA